MEKLVYTSAKGKKVVFEDFNDEREEYGTFWTQICPSCRKKYYGAIPGWMVDECGSGICGVDGCNNEAEYYVDLPEECADVC